MHESLQQTPQLPANSSELFFGWKGVIAICVVLVSTGKLIDWLLRKHHKTAILASLRSLENKLAGTPIRDWQSKVIATIGVIVQRNEHLFQKKDSHLTIAKTLFPAIGSIILTGIGIIIGLSLSQSIDANLYWFIAGEHGLRPNHLISMSLVNFPFDFLTIIISVRLLSLAVKKNLPIEIIAMLDILISAILTILLHTTLKVFETGALSPITQVTESLYWFIDITMLRATPESPDWLITPVLLTTFVPVAAYMGVFIFLGFVLKPVAGTAAYLCGLLGEKQNTPFFELAVVMSMFVAAAKALADWGWFKQAISRYI